MGGGEVRVERFWATCHGLWANHSISEAWPPHLPNRDNHRSS